MKFKIILLLFFASILLAACGEPMAFMYDFTPKKDIIIDVGMVAEHLSGNGWKYDFDDREFFIEKDGEYIVTGTTTYAELGTLKFNGNRVAVGPSLNVTITLLDADIDVNAYYSALTTPPTNVAFPAIEIQNGSKVKLLLKGTNYLKDYINAVGSSTLMVPGGSGGAELVIDSAFASGSANGILMLDCTNSGNPCIGGNNTDGTGAITIMGGTVIANANSGGGPAIGNSWSSTPGSISITGGLVIAIAMSGDNAIGEDSSSSACTVSINAGATDTAMVFATQIASGLIGYTGAIDGSTGVAVNGSGLDSSGIVLTNSSDLKKGGAINLNHDYTVPQGATLVVPTIYGALVWELNTSSNTYSIIGNYTGKVN